MGKAERRKGHNWERLVAAWLTRQGIVARRSGDTGQSEGDLITSLPVTFECKNMRNQTEAIRRGLGQLTDSYYPGVVIVKRRGKPDPADALAVMTLRDWVRLTNPPKSDA